MTIQEIEKILNMLIRHKELKIKTKNVGLKDASAVSFEYNYKIQKYALIIHE